MGMGAEGDRYLQGKLVFALCRVIWLTVQIQQTPDLSSLDPEHLPDETLAALPQITKLKDALYSQVFRNLVREVTGCGPLSGKKTDGSVGLYTQG
jgi:hypothetical protein